MPTSIKKRKSLSAPVDLADNAIAKKAMEAVAQIDADAKEKKLAQLESLQAARAALLQRRSDIDTQLGQIAKGISAVTGQPSSPRPTGEKRTRRNLDELRDRVGRWMEAHKGQKYSAGDLAKEFAELESTPISYFMKLLVDEGKVKTDTGEGIRRTKYYAPE